MFQGLHFIFLDMDFYFKGLNQLDTCFTVYQLFFFNDTYDCRRNRTPLGPLGIYYLFDLIEEIGLLFLGS